MLFGFGIAQQLARHGHRYAYRRMLALSGLGVIHGAILFSGVILLAYAIFGTVFVLLRNRMRQMIQILVGGLGLSVISVAVVSALALALIITFPAIDTSAMGATLQNGGLAEYVGLNIIGWVGFYSEMPFQLFWYIAACCALGNWIYTQFDSIEAAAAAQNPYRALLWSMRVTGNLLYGVFILCGQIDNIPALGYVAATLRPIFGFILMLALFNGLNHLMHRSEKTWPAHAPAKTGRASLNLYIGQSWVGISMFWADGNFNAQVRKTPLCVKYNQKFKKALTIQHYILTIFIR